MTLTAANDVNPGDAKSVRAFEQPTWQVLLLQKIQRAELSAIADVDKIEDVRLHTQELALLKQLLRGHVRCYVS